VAQTPPLPRHPIAQAPGGGFERGWGWIRGRNGHWRQRLKSPERGMAPSSNLLITGQMALAPMVGSSATEFSQVISAEGAAPGPNHDNGTLRGSVKDSNGAAIPMAHLIVHEDIFRTVRCQPKERHHRCSRQRGSLHATTRTGLLRCLRDGGCLCAGVSEGSCNTRTNDRTSGLLEDRRRCSEADR